MLVGAMLLGLGGAALSGGGALISGQSLLMVLGCYVGGGSVTMLGALALGAQGGGRTPKARPVPFQGKSARVA